MNRCSLVLLLALLIVVITTSSAKVSDIVWDSTISTANFNRCRGSALFVSQVDSTDSALRVQNLKRVLTRETVQISSKKRTWRNSKNPRLAMLCTLLLPGLGQMYNERPLKAIIACGMEIFYLHRIIHYRRLASREREIRDSIDRNTERYDWIVHDWWYNEYKERSLDWVWWSAGLVVALLVDSYVDANLHDMDFKVEELSHSGVRGICVSMDF